MMTGVVVVALLPVCFQFVSAVAALLLPVVLIEKSAISVLL